MGKKQRLLDLQAGAILWLGEATIDENLSIEEYLFTQLRIPGPILVLYINRPAVVVGKHQNPWYEASVESLSRNGVPVRRRKSGGGTVYHDEGNLNYSFIMPKDGFSQTQNLKLLASALEQLDITVEITDRGDLFTQGLKFSGNALWYTKDRVLHHGTILVKSNLENLRIALQGFYRTGIAELEGRWVDSKPASVVNLSMITRRVTMASLRKVVTETWMQRYPKGQVVTKDAIDVVQMGQTEEWKQIVQVYQSWEWNFGRTNTFTCRFRDIPQARLQIEEGYIRSLTITDGQGSRIIGVPDARRFCGAEQISAVLDEIRAAESVV